MRVRRDISAIPLRSASETWQYIIDLVSGPQSTDVNQLEQAAGVICSIITDEHLAAHAIIFEGTGPQLRLYLRFGMKAIEDGTATDPLTWNPTHGDWKMHLPCDEENIAWVKEALSAYNRIKVFDMAKESRAESDEALPTVKAEVGIAVDWNIKG